MIDALDMYATYRTAPHIDIEETMARAVYMLLRCLRDHIRPFIVWAPIPVLLPGERTRFLGHVLGLCPGSNTLVQYPRIPLVPRI